MKSSSLAGGLYLFGARGPTRKHIQAKIKKATKKKEKRKKKKLLYLFIYLFNLVSNYSNPGRIFQSPFSEMAPVDTHLFFQPFRPPCQSQSSPDQPNQHVLPSLSLLTAFRTLISLTAGLVKLAVFPSFHLGLGGPEYLCVHLLD
jgi:hypothetical protein